MPEDTKHRRDTVWKLLGAACEQAAEAARATKLPTVLMLTWSVVWFMALYEPKLGSFTNREAAALRQEWAGAVRLDSLVTRREETLIDRSRIEALGKILELCPGREPDKNKAFVQVRELTRCQDDLRGLPDGPEKRQAEAALSAFLMASWTVLRDADVPGDARTAFYRCAERFGWKKPSPAELDRDQIRACRARAEKGADLAFSQQVESRFVALPGGLARISINDLALVGTVALLLLLTWTSLAVQAEYDSIRAFVDFSDSTPTTLWGSSRIVELVPQHSAWQAEHLAFAFHAVRARLFNTFETRWHPMKIVNSAVLLFPVGVAVWEAGTALWWLWRQAGDAHFKEVYPTVLGHTVVEVALLCVVVAIWFRTFRLVNVASDLVRAWHVATEKLWTRNWDESVDVPPRSVTIDLGSREVLQVTTPSAATTPSGESSTGPSAGPTVQP